MSDFLDIYKRMAQKQPISLSVRFIHTGDPRWRIQVLGKEMANIGQPVSSDREILFIERPTWDEAFSAAAEQLSIREREGI